MSTTDNRLAGALSVINAVDVPQPDIKEALHEKFDIGKPFTLHVKGFEPAEGVDFESCRFILALRSPIGGTNKYILSDVWPFTPNTEFQQEFTNQVPIQPFEPGDILRLEVSFRHRNTNLAQTNHADYTCQISAPL